MMINYRDLFGLQSGAEFGIAETATVQQLDALSHAVHLAWVSSRAGCSMRRLSDMLVQ
jgi:hypothetical protein